MKSVILAGGFGTRLRPLTCNIPKPVATVANKPMMEHIVDLLKKHGVTEMISALYFQPESISDYFRDGSDFGIKMDYIKTESELGTAGCVKYATKYIDGTFIVMSGDVLTDFDLTKAVEFHKKKKSLATIVLTRVDNPLAFGVVITDKNGKIVRFLEKPSWGEVFSDTVNTGIYILEKEVLDLIPEEREFDFSKNLFPLMLAKKMPLFGYVAKGYWKDVGSLSEYRISHYDIMDGKVDVIIPGKKTNKVGKGIWIEAGVQIHPTAVLKNPVVIGKNVQIKANVIIENSTIGDNCIIEEGAKITNSVLWSGSFVRQDATVFESVMCHAVEIGKKAAIHTNCVIGDNCIIGDEAVLKANVKLWPHKNVESGAILSTSLIWGDKWSRTIFSEYGVIGLANIEITPEFAAKLGAAYGAGVPKGSSIITSRDNHRISRMTNRAFMTGLLSSGVNVFDIGVTPIGVARYVLKPLRSVGGMHVRMSPFDAEKVDIKFFDDQGIDLASSKEKSIEGLFFREDFRRAPFQEVGEVSFPSHAIDHYREGFLHEVDKEAIRKRKFKLVIDYGFGSSSTIFPSLLGKLECDVVSLNSYLDEKKLTKSANEFNQSIEQLSNITSTLKADLGIMLDAGAEKIFIVDEKGRVLSGDQALCFLTYLQFKVNKGGTIAVPISASSAIDEIAAKHGGKVIRTKTSYRSMMETAISGKVDFVGEALGGYIFPKFMPSLDAMMSVVKILDAMAVVDEKISDIIKKVPESKIIREYVACQWETKGTVMRELNEYAKDKKAELIDGIKIFEKEGWIMILPDGEKPLFHLNAEAKTAEAARKLITKYGQMIKAWQKVGAPEGDTVYDGSEN
ncbi:MAG: nucleotidyltransferase [Candidatus Firestonebacteria bacterium RIFOXYC2_FULL_39_67]|nr:MAG: nucleotidyltransferase [Candidatus Firestonebacteria bacterium RIFOXYD2_FULL_39_29]OGF54543.1 MAG: nucleotidyltransferase [Candidatus Firestonebacteria bacterium RIFOXYC2_FULL_39_67]